MRTLLALLVGTSVCAQTFVVGPTGSYPDIVTAVAAVPSGSVLIVQPGTYAPFQIQQKSVTVIGGGNAVISDFSGTTAVNLLQQGQRVVLSGLQIQGTHGVPRLIVGGNAGTVILDNIVGSAPRGCELTVSSSSDVRINGCSLVPALSTVGILIYSSTVRVSQSTLSPAPFGGPIRVNYSDLVLADVTCTAGAWTTFSLFNSSVRVLGSTSMASTYLPVFGGLGTVRSAPTVSYSSGTSLIFEAGVSATTLAMPSVSASTAPSGGAAIGTMVGSSPGFGWLFAGLTAPATALPGLDPLLLQAGSEVLMASGSLNAAISGSYAAPTAASLIGAAITWQGVSLDPVQGLQISNAPGYVHY